MMNSQNCRPESNFTGLRAALGFTIITEKEIVLMVIIMTTVLYNKQQVDRAHVSMKSSGKSQMQIFFNYDPGNDDFNLNINGLRGNFLLDFMSHMRSQPDRRFLSLCKGVRPSV